MAGLVAGSAFPKIEVPQLGGGTLRLGVARDTHDWQMIVVYRGLHCPICKRYLSQLDEMVDEFAQLGVDVVTLSGDGEAKAQAMVAEMKLGLTMGYDLSLGQMAEMGLYISDPRSAQETDQPFPEPGLFVINGEGNVQILDISNAPFARPDLTSLLGGMKFVRGNGYPIRGMHGVA